MGRPVVVAVPIGFVVHNLACAHPQPLIPLPKYRCAIFGRSNPVPRERRPRCLVAENACKVAKQGVCIIRDFVIVL